MSTLSFTTHSNPEWNRKIEGGLRKECESLVGMKENFKGHSIYVKRGGTFAGGIIVEHCGDILWIDSLWVECNFRKQGLGTQLLQKGLLFAAQNNVQQMQLNTYFQEAHTFFLNCGFEDVAVIPNWKYGLTCYLMRKNVSC